MGTNDDDSVTLSAADHKALLADLEQTTAERDHYHGLYILKLRERDELAGQLMGIQDREVLDAEKIRSLEERLHRAVSLDIHNAALDAFDSLKTKLDRERILREGAEAQANAFLQARIKYEDACKKALAALRGEADGWAAEDVPRAINILEEATKVWVAENIGEAIDKVVASGDHSFAAVRDASTSGSTGGSIG